MPEMLLANHERFSIGSRSRRPDPRRLFSNNEPGLAIDVGDRNGASEAKRTWRRNVVTYSQDFENAAWVKLNVSVTANTQVAPDGTTTADTLTDDATAGLHYIQHGSFSTNTDGQRFCRSVYVKKGTARYIAISPINTFNNSINVLLFDFDTGSYVNTPDPSYIDGYDTPEDVGNGWWRLSFWSDQTGPGYGRVNLAIYNSSNPASGSYSGVGDTVHIWGFQAEYNETSPTTYQPITDFHTEFKQAYPNHSLYQDSNGVSAAVYPNDPVGLVIDSSRGGLEAATTELVPDPLLNDVSTWVLDAGWTGSSGNLVLDNSVAGAQIFANSPQILTQNKWYVVEVEVTAYSGSGGIRIDCRPFSGGTGSTNHATLTTVGTHRTIVFNSGANTRISLRAPSNVSPLTATIARVSVKEIPGIHPYQTTSGSRPALCRTPDGGRRNLLTYSDLIIGAVSGTPGTAPTGWSLTANGGTATVTTEGLRVSATANRHTYSQVHAVLANTTYCFSAICDIHVTDNNHQIIDSVVIPAGATSVTYQDGVALTDYQNFTQATNSLIEVVVTVGATAGNVTLRFGAGVNNINTASDVTFKQLQFEVGSIRSTYQRVTTTHDVTESGKRDCWGLYADGSDDSLITSSVDFPSATVGTQRNFLRSSETFSPNWTVGVASATYGEAGPEGRNNATTFTTALSGGPTHLQSGIPYVPNQPYVLTFWVKAGTATGAGVGMYANAAFLSATGSTLSGPGTIAGTGLQTLATLSAVEWTKYQLLFTAPASGTLELYFYGETSGVKTGKTQTIAQFQIEPGSTPTDYQPTGTDKMTVMAGLNKRSDAASACFVELGTDAGSVNGTFAVYAPRVANAAVEYRSRGSTAVTSTEGMTSPAPTTLIFTGISDIAGDMLIVRKDGTVKNTNTGDQGSGNYANLALNLMRRSGGTIPFSGILYTLIIRGAATPTGTIADFERNLLAKRAGVTF
jgi:hypothetical protein